MLLHSTDELLKPPVRIVSLVPSQTELLYHLGLQATVVGITKFCIHPANWQTTKSIVGGTKNINIEKIKSLNPDLIIANKEENVEDQILELSKDFPVWVTDVFNLGDALQMINDIGHLTKTASTAYKLTIEIENGFKKLPGHAKKINTCYLIWKAPYMSVGGDTFINDMLNYCGYLNLYADAMRYPVVEINNLIQKDCKLLLLSTEPYPFKQKLIAELKLQLPATKIILVDGEMFSWYGSRLSKAPAYFKQLFVQTKDILEKEPS